MNMGTVPLWVADAILLIHAAFVAFVVISVPLIMLGGWRGWTWVRRPAFRISHLLAIGFVVGNTWLGELCPLTIWEREIRREAGEAGYASGFIAHWLGQVLYYDLPTAFFVVLYTAFLLLVLALWWRVPVCWNYRERR